MIELASNWNLEDIKKAELAFKNRKKHKNIWRNTKKKYCDFLLEIKQIWDECEEDIGDLKEEIFF